MRADWLGDALSACASAHADRSTGMTRMNTIQDAVRQALDEWVSDVERLEADLAAGWPA